MLLTFMFPVQLLHFGSGDTGPHVLDYDWLPTVPAACKQLIRRSSRTDFLSRHQTGLDSWARRKCGWCLQVACCSVYLQRTRTPEAGTEHKALNATYLRVDVLCRRLALIMGSTDL
jgi:hypothetical protein